MELEELSMKQSRIVSYMDVMMYNLMHVHNEYALIYSLVDRHDDCSTYDIPDNTMMNHISDLVSSEFTRYKQLLEAVMNDFTKLNHMISDYAASWSCCINDTNYGNHVFQMKSLLEDLEKVYNKAEDVYDEYNGFNKRIKGVFSWLNTDEIIDEGDEKK